MRALTAVVGALALAVGACGGSETDSAGPAGTDVGIADVTVTVSTSRVERTADSTTSVVPPSSSTPSTTAPATTTTAAPSTTAPPTTAPPPPPTTAPTTPPPTTTTAPEPTVLVRIELERIDVEADCDPIGGDGDFEFEAAISVNGLVALRDLQGSRRDPIKLDSGSSLRIGRATVVGPLVGGVEVSASFRAIEWDVPGGDPSLSPRFASSDPVTLEDARSGQIALGAAGSGCRVALVWNAGITDEQAP